MEKSHLFNIYIIFIIGLSFISLSSGKCIAAAPNYKNNYKGLVPGYSTLDDAYRALGKPRNIKAAGKGKNYYFKGVIVNFAGEETLINTIQIIKDFNYVGPNGISLNNDLQKVKRSMNNPVIRNNVIMDKTKGVVYWFKKGKVNKITLLHVGPFDSLKGVKGFKKQKFNMKKCVNADFHYSNYLTQAEICRYRDRGCLITSNYKNKVKMHCLEGNLSSCFEKEGWKTINEIVGLEDRIDVGNESKNISVIKGKMSVQVCAHYNE